jgi:hypothetical protein
MRQIRVRMRSMRRYVTYLAHPSHTCAYAFDEALRDVSSSSVSVHTGMRIYSIYIYMRVYICISICLYLYI